MDEDEKVRFWKELDKLGVNEVRLRLEAGRTYGEQRSPYVREWLRQQDRVLSDEEARKNDASRAEELSIAREAKEAAWVSARASERAASAAEVANKKATTAQIIAAISAIIAAAALVISLLAYLYPVNLVH